MGNIVMNWDDAFNLYKLQKAPGICYKCGLYDSKFIKKLHYDWAYYYVRLFFTCFKEVHKSYWLFSRCIFFNETQKLQYNCKRVKKDRQFFPFLFHTWKHSGLEWKKGRWLNFHFLMYIISFQISFSAHSRIMITKALLELVRLTSNIQLFNRI